MFPLTYVPSSAVIYYSYYYSRNQFFRCCLSEDISTNLSELTKPMSARSLNIFQWYGHHLKYVIINSTEAVRRAITKILHIAKCLKNLHLQTLEHRCLITDLSPRFTILYELDFSLFLNFLLTFRLPSGVKNYPRLV